MLEYEEALNVLIDNAQILDKENVKTKESFRRVLAEDLYTDYPFPDHKKSAVDGYAVKFPVKKEYTIIGESVPGKLYDYILDEGETIFVMTGGAVPQNTDAVIRIEDTKKYSGNKIIINKYPNKGENVNQIGEEISKNTLFAKKGCFLENLAFSAICYSGKKEINVYKKPQIGLFITGNEIIEPGDDYIEGSVYNTNRYITQSLLGNLPIDIKYLGNFSDNEERISDLIKDNSIKFDILISSGGISMGKYDFVKKVLLNNNYDILINKTAIKPGSPLIAAKNNGCTIFGMPGYPSAFATNFILYLLPFIRKSCGFTKYNNRIVKGKLGTPMHSRRGVNYFNRAVVRYEGDAFVAYDPGSQKTSHFLNFINVNGLVRLDKDVGDLDKRSVVDIILI
ncbi:MAG: molybdopterin molybdotransferase MoeA [Deferribacterota bacterium]|nr:molybdopterin molybdotransferase MoeA [Deferribacterota bacterium]